jgi:hypothetical protein
MFEEEERKVVEQCGHTTSQIRATTQKQLADGFCQQTGYRTQE